MKDPEELIKETVGRASVILAEYVEPGKRDCETTIERLLSTLDNDDLVEAPAESDEMERHNGGRQDERMVPGQVPH